MHLFAASFARSAACQLYASGLSAAAPDLEVPGLGIQAYCPGVRIVSDVSRTHELPAPGSGRGPAIPTRALRFSGNAPPAIRPRRAHLTGPSLAGVWGRKAGTAKGFGRYSEALKKADVVWGRETLDQWLADPARYIPGNTMTFAGFRGSRDREDLIAYLRAVSEGDAAAAALPRRGRMGMMGGGKIDLKKAPLAGQVESIRHCGDAYTVRTADGKESKVWEFNLRFKTDSSNLGPPRDGPWWSGPACGATGLRWCSRRRRRSARSSSAPAIESKPPPK